MFLLWVVACIGLEVLFRVFFAFTVHRGIFHTIGMGILFSQIVILIFDYYFDYCCVVIWSQKDTRTC